MSRQRILRRRSITLLVLVSSLAVACGGGSSDHRDQQAEMTSQVVLGQVVDELNKSLPMTVDEETELLEVSSLDSTLVYSYRLVRAVRAEIDPEEFVAQVQPRTSGQVCTAPDTRDAFLKQGVTLRYAYTDRHGEPVATFDITPQHCGFQEGSS